MKFWKVHTLSLLAILTLSACGDEDEDEEEDEDEDYISIIGNVIKGPLNNVLVFLNYNNNGQSDFVVTDFV